MKRKSRGHEPAAKAARRRTAGKDSTRSAKPRHDGGDLDKTLALIRSHPGIRPSEINRLLNRDESDGLRSTLIKRGLIRKQKDGSAMRYYPV
jgi:hypothetical protein